MKKRYYFLGLSTACIAIMLMIQFEPFHPSSGDRTLQIGDSFPTVRGELLTRQDFTVPRDLRGQVAVLIPVFKQGSQSLVDTWTADLFPKMGEHPDLRVIEMPMIRNWKWASGFVDNAMRGGIPQPLHENVFTYYGRMRNYYDQFGTDRPTEIHVYVLDREGKIRFIERGRATNDKLEALWEVVEEELKN